MENNDFSPQEELRFTIAKLKMEKQLQGDHSKFVFQELIGSVDNVAIIKNYLKHVVKDKEVQFDLIKMGMKYGSKLLINKLYTVDKEDQGIISTELLETTADAFIEKNAAAMVIKIADWMQPKKDTSNQS